MGMKLREFSNAGLEEQGKALATCLPNQVDRLNAHGLIWPSKPPVQIACLKAENPPDNYKAANEPDHPVNEGDPSKGAKSAESSLHSRGVKMNYAWRGNREKSSRHRAKKLCLTHETYLASVEYLTIEISLRPLLSYMPSSRPKSRLQQLREQIREMSGNDVAPKFETLQLHAGMLEPSAILISDYSKIL